jgi:RhoGAP domain
MLCVSALSQALVTLLSSLREPVIPVSLCPAILPDDPHLGAWANVFLKGLPQLNCAVLLYLVKLFRAVLQYKDTNNLTAARYVVCCTLGIQNVALLACY